MTTPSLYQQEMAKRGLVLPKKEACPRKAIKFVVTVPKVERTVPRAKANDRSRWSEWVDLYRAGLTLTEIATQYGVSHQSVAYAMKQLNEPRRPNGDGFTHKRLVAQLEALRKENTLLRARLAGLRRRGITEEAA